MLGFFCQIITDSHTFLLEIDGSHAEEDEVWRVLQETQAPVVTLPGVIQGSALVIAVAHQSPHVCILPIWWTDSQVSVRKRCSLNKSGCHPTVLWHWQPHVTSTSHLMHFNCVVQHGSKMTTEVCSCNSKSLVFDLHVCKWANSVLNWLFSI